MSFNLEKKIQRAIIVQLERKKYIVNFLIFHQESILSLNVKVQIILIEPLDKIKRSIMIHLPIIMTMESML